MNLEKANKLIDEAIEDGKEYLPRLKAGLSNVAALLQEGRDGEGINLFIQSIEGLEWLETVLNGMECFSHSLICGDEKENVIVRYRQTLSDLLEAWENGDMVLICDLIEFEIVPVIEIILERISQGREH